MGDRTSVTLTVLTAHADRTREIIGDVVDSSKLPCNRTEFYFDEVTYGNLNFLDALQEAGIPYESAWSRGDEYGEGAQYCWFTPEGAGLVKEVYDSGRNPELTLLLEFIDQPEKLKQVILEHVEKVSAPSWDNQEEYAKIYMTRKLIAP